MPKSQTTEDTEAGAEFDLDNAQCELDEAIRAAKAVVYALELAESCETAADYHANIADAKDESEALRKELDGLT